MLSIIQSLHAQNMFLPCVMQDPLLDLLQLLVEAGADPTAQDALGRTPLQVAIASGNTACVGFLALRECRQQACNVVSFELYLRVYSDQPSKHVWSIMVLHIPHDACLQLHNQCHAPLVLSPDTT
jgi:ankyrin repeat protein